MSDRFKVITSQRSLIESLNGIDSYYILDTKRNRDSRWFDDKAEAKAEAKTRNERAARRSPTP